MNARNAFEYSVNRILNKRCVPVAGAGLSLASSHPSGDRVHNVGWMINALKEDLIKLRMARYDQKTHGSACSGCIVELKYFGHNGVDDACQGTCFFCDIVTAAKRNQLGLLSELFVWEFHPVKDGYKNLVTLLKIDTYRELEPTGAHLYMAKLAREGLINEIITTNYDCNFEKAYNHISGGNNSDIISNLDAYRRLGAAIGPVNRLKVFKVNGCSDELNIAEHEDRYESILLTERQLQKWRNRQWAADVFRDRLRSKSLLFIGFGSDEPQIHHTLQTVLDEYADEIEKNNTPVLKTHSAPIVAIYEAFPAFHQQQIVNTYALHHRQNPQDGNQLIIRSPNAGATLPADTLWRLIYERVMREVIIDALQSSLNAANASFTSVVPFCSVIIHEVISSLENSRTKDINYSTEAPDWLINITSIAAKITTNDGYYCALAEALVGLTNAPGGHYEPVGSNRALMSEFATLLVLLKDVISSKIDVEDGHGLSLVVKQGGDGSEKIFYLNADPAIVSHPVEVAMPVGNNHLTLVLGQAGTHVRPSIRRVRNCNSAKSAITPKTIVILGWKHVFYAKPYDGNKDKVSQTMLDAIESPTNYFYANQPSIKRRTYLKEVK